MAERRMFAKAIIDSDAFIDMPVSARLLYYDLAMRADDDGFVNSPKKIMRMIGATVDDMNILLMRKFVIAFDSGVVVIKHWRIHNYIQSDRYKPTKYSEEKAQLALKPNGAYTMDTKCIQPVSSVDTPCIQAGYNMDTQVRLGKDSLGKVSQDSGQKRSSRFTPPTLEEVKAYASEAQLHVDPERFYRYFTTPNDKGETWVDSKGNKVKNWKQKMLTWDKTDSTIKTAVAQEKPRKKSNFDNYQEYGVSHPRLEDIDFDIDEL